jgi:GNAT superfamily N-acetyltransferase
MELTVEPITEADLPEIAAVMKRAFDDDSRRHLGIDEGGPPGYDDGEFFRTWLFGYDESDGGKVMVDGEVAGAFIVWPFEQARLGTIFVDPPRQRRGLGSAIMAYIEEAYPARTWTLDTPVWATGNHRFYEGCGFERVGVTEDSVTYHKVL